MKIPPLVWLVGWLGVQRTISNCAGGNKPGFGSSVVGFSLIAAGALTAAEGVRELNANGASINPISPDRSKTLVTNGIYSRTRNPIYLGMVTALAGTAMLSGLKRNLLTVPAAMLALHSQIDNEEMALIDNHGVDFIEYHQKVPRWL